MNLWKQGFLTDFQLQPRQDGCDPDLKDEGPFELGLRKTREKNYSKKIKFKTTSEFKVSLFSNFQ